MFFLLFFFTCDAKEVIKFVGLFELGYNFCRYR